MSIFGGTINNTEVTKASFFTTYFPILNPTSGSITNTSTNGRYIQLGKLVYVQVFANFDVVSGSPTLFLTLPFSIDQGEPALFTVLTGINLLNNQAIHGFDGLGNILIVTTANGSGFIGTSNRLHLSGWFPRK